MREAAVTYTSYLALEQVLGAQHPLSKLPETGEAEHDELLFIVIHQVYELWFKQLLHELDYACRCLYANEQPRVLHTLRRMLTILKTVVSQIDILETMTPLEFDSFRTYLGSSSGFQSSQFRELEFALGYKRESILQHFPEEMPQRQCLQKRYTAPTLWYAFLHFLHANGCAVPPEQLQRDVTAAIAPLLMLQATLIDLYRNRPDLAQICERLVDLDEGLQEWRYRHIKMVERTISVKMGIGYLAREGIATDYIARKANARTGLALVAVQPPNRFPLVFYRDHPADIDLTIDDVARAPLAQCRVVQLSGTAFGRGSCREAMLFAVEQCRNAGVTTVIDLDLRPDQWSQPRAFGVILRAMLPHLQIVIGTEEEFFVLLAEDPTPALQGGPLLPAQLAALEESLQGVLAAVQSPKVLVVKRGARGVSLYPRRGPNCHVPGFSVEVVNMVGAGDAFASGLIYGYLQGWEWQQCARFGNACGVLTVTRHGCSAALPNWAEVLEFLKLHGG